MMIFTAVPSFWRLSWCQQDEDFFDGFESIEISIGKYACATAEGFSMVVELTEGI